MVIIAREFRSTKKNGGQAGLAAVDTARRDG
jgi:hypothetical protein